MSVVSANATEFFQQRMVLLHEQERIPTSSIVSGKIFDKIIISDCSGKPYAKSVWKEKKQIKLFQNDTYHLVRLHFHDARNSVDILPLTTKQVGLVPDDFVNPPLLEYPHAQFLQVTSRLAEFHDYFKGIYLLKFDFLKFTSLIIGYLENQLVLKVSAEKERNREVVPKKFKFDRDQTVQCRAFKENCYIHVMFRNRRGKYYGSFVKENPRIIQKITLQILDCNEWKTVILEAPFSEGEKQA